MIHVELDKFKTLHNQILLDNSDRKTRYVLIYKQATGSKYIYIYMQCKTHKLVKIILNFDIHYSQYKKDVVTIFSEDPLISSQLSEMPCIKKITDLTTEYRETTYENSIIDRLKYNV